MSFSSLNQVQRKNCAGVYQAGTYCVSEMRTLATVCCSSQCSIWYCFDIRNGNFLGEIPQSKEEGSQDRFFHSLSLSFRSHVVLILLFSVLQHPVYFKALLFFDWPLLFYFVLGPKELFQFHSSRAFHLRHPLIYPSQVKVSDKHQWFLISQ